MNALATAIRSAGLTGTAAEVRTALGETVEVSRDSTAYTWSGVNQRLIALGVDPLIVAGWDQAVAAIPGGTMLDRMLTSGGVDFTGPVIRAQLAAVAAQASADVAAVLTALLAIGVQTGPRWQSMGLDSLPSVEQITTAQAQIANVDWIQNTLEPLVMTLRTNGGTLAETKAALLAAVES